MLSPPELLSTFAPGPVSVRLPAPRFTRLPPPGLVSNPESVALVPLATSRAKLPVPPDAMTTPDAVPPPRSRTTGAVTVIALALNRSTAPLFSTTDGVPASAFAPATSSVPAAMVVAPE